MSAKKVKTGGPELCSPPHPIRKKRGNTVAWNDLSLCNPIYGFSLCGKISHLKKFLLSSIPGISLIFIFIVPDGSSSSDQSACNDIQHVGIVRSVHGRLSTVSPSFSGVNLLQQLGVLYGSHQCRYAIGTDSARLRDLLNRWGWRCPSRGWRCFSG